jgi:uncharacterized protein (TIGR03435 family)
MMQGPMMRALLEDRFKLKLHRETRGEIPVYAMTVVEGGFKLHALEEGACAACDSLRTEGNGPDSVLVAEGMSLDMLASWLAPFVGLDRPSVSGTGIRGRFSFRVEYAAEEPTSIPGALEKQTGLKLEAAKAPQETLVIERVERPSQN